MDAGVVTAVDFACVRKLRIDDIRSIIAGFFHVSPSFFLPCVPLWPSWLVDFAPCVFLFVLYKKSDLGIGWYGIFPILIVVSLFWICPGPGTMK